MHFHSPERKHLPGGAAPLLQGFSSVLPGLMLRPDEQDGLWEIGCFLPNALNSFSYYQHTCTGAALNQLLFEYANNPEQFFKEVFKWTPPEMLTRTFSPRSTLTLEDLGL